MESTDSPFDKLLGESLPRLNKAMAEYYDLATPRCSPEQGQLLGELSRRIKQCDFLLRNVATLEQRQFSLSLNVLAAVARNQPDADERFEASCQELDVMRLFTESFYWVAHKASSVISARQDCFRDKRLPKMPSKIAHRGVTNVRNHLIEHPFEYSETFSIGGMWFGPVLNGGLGRDANGNEVKDSGLYFNAIEWAETVAAVLARASEQLRVEKKAT